MDAKYTLKGLSLLFAAILSFSLIMQAETNLSGLELNLKIDSFSKTKAGTLKIEGNSKKPPRKDSQGETGAN